MELLKLFLALAIVAGIVYSVVKIFVYTHRHLRSAVRSLPVLLLSHLALIAAAFAVGFCLAAFRWNFSETQRVNGLPIPWAAWEYQNGSWIGFVSPLSVFVFALDVLIGIALVHLPAAIWVYVRNRKAKRTEKLLVRESL